jgi:hypothetical protein
MVSRPTQFVPQWQYASLYPGTTLESKKGAPHDNGNVKSREAAMRYDDKKHREDGHHVVFDFTGTAQANVGDLALILTARLRSAPGDSVWVRALPDRTAEILEYLRLDHLFLRMPEQEGPLN